MSYLQKKFTKKHSHRYFKDLNSPMQELVCLCGKVRGSPKAAPNKYHAKSTFYAGYSYDSIFEANYAMQLDWRVAAGDIRNNGCQIGSQYFRVGLYIKSSRIARNDSSRTGNILLIFTNSCSPSCITMLPTAPPRVPTGQPTHGPQNARVSLKVATSKTNGIDAD